MIGQFGQTALPVLNVFYVQNDGDQCILEAEYYSDAKCFCFSITLQNALNCSFKMFLSLNFHHTGILSVDQ